MSAGPSARDLWHELHAYRRSRRSVDATEVYTAVFGVALLVAMGGGALLTVPLPLVSCASSSCMTALTWAPFASLLLTLAIAAVLAAIIGPIAVSRAESFWLLSSPVDRGELLRRSLVQVAAVGALGGLASWACVLLTFGGTLWWAPVFVAATAGCVMGLVALQSSDARLSPLTVVGATILGSAMASLIGVLAGTNGVAMPVSGALALAAASALGALLSWRVGRSALGGVPVQLLAGRAQLRAGLAGAAASADTGLAFDILTTKLLVTSAAPGRLRGVGRGLAAVAFLELRRTLTRSPRVLLGLPIPLAVVTATYALGIASVGAVVTALTLAMALALVLTGLRIVQRAPGLARCLPFRPSLLRLAMSATALAASALWAAASGAILIATGYPALNAFGSTLTIALAAFAGAVRWTCGSSPDFSTGYVMTDAGPVPLGALAAITRGPDLIVILILPLSLGLQPWLCVPAAAFGAWRAIRRG